ncbi:hypothetical protein PsYK624_148840 [Phanerochaete sordida]|uniref:Uncharacterized protein n=1 Tax=Phanerochaete sordida TaxID=48140 RepID=A0A9P3LLF7_9APHY|nr:hypothetical protein PsYK624_148840 [Phanerochaete sordida]
MRRAALWTCPDGKSIPNAGYGDAGLDDARIQTSGRALFCVTDESRNVRDTGSCGLMKLESWRALRCSAATLDSNILPILVPRWSVLLPAGRYDTGAVYQHPNISTS